MNTNLFNVIYGLAHQSASFDQIIIFCATWWLPLVVLILTLTIVLARSARDRIPRRAVFIISAPIIAWLIAQGLKVWLAWPRPATALTSVRPLFSADGSAFPSGHATLFFALAFALYPFHPRLATLVSVSAIIISLARVAAGVHFPGDILGGFVLAGLVVLISWTFVKVHFSAFGGREMV
jgi:undecaprenyl-diphosphatase